MKYTNYNSLFIRIRTSENKMFAKRNENYEKFRHLRGAVILIEGLIGAGKTTIGNHLVSFLNDAGLPAYFFPEYRNDLLLNQYIKNPKKYAYSFQIFMLAKRISIYKEAIDKAKTGTIVFIDRSIIGDQSFAYMHYTAGNITEEEYQIYQEVAKQENLLSPSYYIYLETSVTTCMDRIKKRGILSEVRGYTPEYLQELKDAYLEMRKQYRVPEVCIPWDTNDCNTDSCNMILSLCSK